MYIIPDPLAGVLGKGLYESIKKFKTFGDGPVVMERDGCIESVTKVETSSYSRDWSRYGTYQVGKNWAHRNDFFREMYDIQTYTDGQEELKITSKKKVTYDIETSNPCAEIYMNDATGEVMFKQLEAPLGILYYMDVIIYNGWEDDPYAMLLIELL